MKYHLRYIIRSAYGIDYSVLTYTLNMFDYLFNTANLSSQRENIQIGLRLRGSYSTLKEPRISGLDGGALTWSIGLLMNLSKIQRANLSIFANSFFLH